jgi:hypothetical protein
VGDTWLLQCWQPFLLTLSGVYAPIELLPGAEGLAAVEDASTALTAAMDAGGGALRYEHKLCDDIAAGSARLSLSDAECEIPDADAAARVAVNAAACAATGIAGEGRMLLTPLACLAEYQANPPSPAVAADDSAVSDDDPAEPAVPPGVPPVAFDEAAAADDDADGAAPFDVATCLELITDVADVLPDAGSDWIGELAELPGLSAAGEDAEDEEGDEGDSNDEDGDAQAKAEQEDEDAVEEGREDVEEED